MKKSFEAVKKNNNWCLHYFSFAVVVFTDSGYSALFVPGSLCVDVSWRSSALCYVDWSIWSWKVENQVVLFGSIWYTGYHSLHFCCSRSHWIWNTKLVSIRRCLLILNNLEHCFYVHMSMLRDTTELCTPPKSICKQYCRRNNAKNAQLWLCYSTLFKV